jgi:hypothetical protein
LAHPILALLVGAAALLAALGLGKAAQEVVERTIKAHNFNEVTLRIMHLALWESRFKRLLDEGRATSQFEIKKVIQESLAKEGVAGKLTAAFDEMAARIVADLGVLEQIGSD